MIKHLAMAAAILAGTTATAHAADPLMGFSVNGQAINPVCLAKMAPLVSDPGLILRAINLDACQDSNWAYNDTPAQVDQATVSTTIDGEPFSYQVLGRTTSGVFLVRQTGNEIYAYRIDVLPLKPDLLAAETKPAQVLTVLGQSFVPCLQSATVQGNVLVVVKQASDMDAPRAGQCKTKLQTVRYPIGN